MILTGISVVSSIGAVLLAIHETPKAIEVLDNHRLEIDETGKTDLAPMEKVKDYAKTYWPTGLCLLASIGTGIASCVISQKQIKGILVSAAGVSAAYAKYKNKIADVIGEEKARLIDQQVKKEIKENKDPVDLNSKKWFYDPVTESFFQMTLLEFEKAKQDINRDINTCGFAVMADAFPALKKLAPKGSKAAWFYDELIESCGYSWLEVSAYPRNIPGSENAEIDWKFNDGRETYHIEYEVWPLPPEIAKDYQYIGSNETYEITDRTC